MRPRSAAAARWAAARRVVPQTRRSPLGRGATSVAPEGVACSPVPVKGGLRRPSALVRLLRARRPRVCWSRADAGVVLEAQAVLARRCKSRPVLIGPPPALDLPDQAVLSSER
ncbi:MAG TPA: hypothetical protein VFS21_29680 [Roseiflexaceae bacterium]|nr:hypothetical protein [Roseiflexaceae bacterium]